MSGHKRKVPEEKEVPGEEGEEIKSPRRKVIRVESEETQDYVRQAKSAEQEEVEERILYQVRSVFRRK